MRHVILGIGLSLAALVVDMSMAHALPCRNDEDLWSCCSRIHGTGGAGDVDYPNGDGTYTELTCSEVVVIPDDDDDEWPCSPAGCWEPPPEPDPTPEPDDGYGGSGPSGPTSDEAADAINCTPGLCSAITVECGLIQVADAAQTLEDLRDHAEYLCNAGRRGEFRSGLEFTAGDICYKYARTGLVCVDFNDKGFPIATRDPRCGRDPIGGYNYEWLAPCADVCVDSWMKGDERGTLAFTGFKVKFSRRGPSIELGFNYGKHEEYWAFEEVAKRAEEEGKGACLTEVFAECKMDERENCGDIAPYSYLDNLLDSYYYELTGKTTKPSRVFK